MMIKSSRIGWAEDIACMLGMRDEYKFLFEILKGKKRNHFRDMGLDLKIKYR